MLERIWKQTTPECELCPKRAALHGPNIRDQVLRRAGSRSWWAALSTRRAPAFSSPVPPSSSSASSSSAASTTAGWEGTWERPTGGRSFQVLQTLTPPQTPCILPEALSDWEKGVNWFLFSLTQNLSQCPVNLFKKSSVSGAPKLSKFCRSPLNTEFCQENIACQSIKYYLRIIMKLKFIRIKCTFKFTSVVPWIPQHRVSNCVITWIITICLKYCLPGTFYPV